jgi:hypothetical protein
LGLESGRKSGGIKETNKNTSFPRRRESNRGLVKDSLLKMDFRFRGSKQSLVFVFAPMNIVNQELLVIPQGGIYE